MIHYLIVAFALFHMLFLSSSVRAQQIISANVPLESLSGITNCTGSCDAAPAWGSTVPPFAGTGFMGFHEFLTFGGEAWSVPINQVLVAGNSYTYRVMATIAPITGGTWPPSGGGNHDGIIYVYVGSSACSQNQLIGTIQLFTPADVNNWKRFCFTFTSNGNYNRIFFRAKTEPQDYTDCAYMGIDDVIDALSVISTPVSCGSGNNGTATATLTGGTPPYTYSWNPGGQTASTATGLSPGTYTVSATDANGCAGGTQTVTVTGSGGVIATSASSNAACIGSANGTATVTPLGGTAPYTFSWLPSGGTATSASGLTAGTYSVTVTDAGGCTGTQLITITSSGNITATAGPNSTVCAGQNVVLNATGGGNYLWSQGTTNAVVTVTPNQTTTYSVVVSSGSCLDTAFVTVVVNPSPSVALGNDQTVCTGQDFTLNAGNPGASYFWSTGETSQSITVSGAGTHWVIVGVNNCLAKDTILIFVAPKVRLFDSSLCTTSPILLDPGSGASSYLWSTGSISQTISVDVGGVYWVVAVFGNCISGDSSVITGDGTGGTLFVPNAFTPNDDPLNELFLAKGTGIASFGMNIFDRWGNLIFASDDINEGWNGKIQGGNYILKQAGKEAAQEDVYIWKIEYTLQCVPDIINKKIGHVSIIK